MRRILLACILLSILTSGINLPTDIWLYKWDNARVEATERDKPILLVFSGSDWCKPCMRLDEQVFQTAEFKSFAKEHLVLLKADFPRSKKNQLPEEIQEEAEKLAEQYNPQGYFPKVVLVSKEGGVLCQVSAIPQAEQFLNELQKALKP